MKKPNRLITACALALTLVAVACAREDDGMNAEDAKAPPTETVQPEGGPDGE